MREQSKCLNEYRVRGTFSYTDYDDGPELLKTVDKWVDAYSEKEAEDLIIELYKGEWPDACWLMGHPTVRYRWSVIEREYALSGYWTRKAAEQAVLREAVRRASSRNE